MQPTSFDRYADQYDADFTFSAIGLLQRNQVYNKLLPLLNKNINLLELNCGTGHDALALIGEVKTILATDASNAMIETCRFKTKNKIPNLEFKTLAIQQIKGDLSGANFVFSNFGGLNCLAPIEFKEFAIKCKDLMPTKSDLFFVIMGRKCVWERLYFFLKLDFPKGYRRKQKNGVNTIIKDSAFKTWYYSPKEISELFAPHFQEISRGSIGLFVPPSYLNPFFKNKRILLRVFELLDHFFCKFSLLANYGDHFYIHLKKAQ